MSEYALPSKILPGLRRLRGHYKKRRETDLETIIENSSVFIELAADFDNWDGGQTGHNVLLFVPDEVMNLIDLDEQDEIFQRLQRDLNKTAPEVQNEYVAGVFVKPTDDADPQCQASIPFTEEPRAKPEDVGLWQQNSLRLFVSHRDNHKAVANQLAESLRPYGVTSFVAHDAIKPMREWQKEILNGLMTMEVMLVLLTEDFHDSVWTNQEIGFALGKEIPIICLKVGSVDPGGFIGSRQALRASYEDIESSASDIHRALISEIGQEGRLKEILIESFISSTSYIDAIDNLTRLTETADKLTDTEFSKIVSGYAANDQLHNCAGIHNRNNWFKRYLESATGKKLKFDNGLISIEASFNSDDEFPF